MNIKTKGQLEKERLDEEKHQSFKEKELIEGKSYIFSELGSDGKVKGGTHAKSIRGKIVNDFESFYRVNTGKYITCINKRSLMDFNVKEVN